MENCIYDEFYNFIFMNYYLKWVFMNSIDWKTIC